MTVSFGKIFIVDAPLKTAQEIAKIANGKSKTKTAEQIKSVINDTRKGKAHAFPVDYSSNNQSYIISGKEGKQFGRDFGDAMGRIEFVDRVFQEQKIKDSDISFTWRRLLEQIEELKASSKNVHKMNVEYTNLGDVKSVNVIA